MGAHYSSRRQKTIEVWEFGLIFSFRHFAPCKQTWMKSNDKGWATIQEGASAIQLVFAEDRLVVDRVRGGAG